MSALIESGEFSATAAAGSLASLTQSFRSRLQSTRPVRRVGRVAQVTGLVVESEGPNASLGEVCQIRNGPGEPPVHAEVVGFRNQRILLMPLGDMQNVRSGAAVVATSRSVSIPVGMGMLGRVIDGLGNPIDGLGPIEVQAMQPLRSAPPNPLKRERISESFSTGVRAIDVFTPVGVGQRVGIFAGSGVGKSTLLGMMARGAESDINVIALIGERGRELREFIEKDLGPEGLARSIIIVATSDQAPLVRMRAALLATAVAEYFRDFGRKVLFMMDSVTRFAMAQREIGLSVGEAPSSRGYTPSVFSMLPRLLERTGNAERGSITAFYTVLVEGDDMNEPIADAVRGILDGHIVLSRSLATANHFPAIDVLESVSRVNRDISTPEELLAASTARDLLAVYRKNEDLINIGAYVKGANPKLDLAISKHEALLKFMRQAVDDKAPRPASVEQMATILR
jgi:flagellum-specific ATP synthase